MHFRHIKKIFFVIALVALSVTAFSVFHTKTKTAEAQVDAVPIGNVYGFAWSSTIGWVSMNCDQSAHGGVNRCTSSNTVGSVDYGVNLDQTTGAMTGYGWSDTVGWVKFDPTSPPAYGANSGTSGALVTNIAADSVVKPVVGWIRFCSNTNTAHVPDNCGNTSNAANSENGGWNGWVSMAGTGGGQRFGVSYDTTSGHFSGFAWGGTTNLLGSEVVGWLNFDMVVADISPTSYIPVVKMSGLSPVPLLGDTDITYNLVNAAPTVPDQLTLCKPFTSHAVTNNAGDWGGAWNTPLTPLPALTSNTKAHIYVWAPTTTYYLDCVNGLGIHAADPSNPTVQCDLNNPANTCPRTTVTLGNPPTYIPVVKMDATSPIVTGGDTDITYELTNNPPTSQDDLVTCAPFTSHLPGGNNGEWATTSISPLPQFNNPNTIINRYAWAPNTTYYLDCRNGLGVHAADPSNPTVQCDINNPASTCPRTKVIVSTPSRNIVLRGKGPTQAAFNMGPISIQAGESVSLEWQSPTATTLTQCEGTTTNFVPSWETVALTGLNAGNSYRAVLGNVPPTQPVTDFNITCYDAASGTYISPLQTIRVQIVPPSSDLTLEVKESSQSVYGAGPIHVNPGDTVSLQWKSTSAKNTCVAVSSAGVWDGTKAGLPTSPFTANENLVQVTAPQTVYQISCVDTASGATVSSSPVIVIVDPAPTGIELKIKLASQANVAANYSNTVSVSSTDFVTLSWVSLAPIQPGSCVGSSSPSIPGWNGALANPGATFGAVIKDMIDLDRVNTTTYTITCTTTAGVTVSDTAFAVPVVPLGPAVSIIGPTCVKNENVLFDLYFATQNIAGGSCTLSNDGWFAGLWTGTRAIAVDGNYRVAAISIPFALGQVTFNAQCTDLGGTTVFAAPHTVLIDPNCTQPPRRDWHFQFFEH